MGITYCSLASGSSGNCHYISCKGKRILVDAGLSGKRIQNRLAEIDVNPEELTEIFVTHEHHDHICGVGVLSRRFDLPIYANGKTWEAMGEKLGRIKTKNIRTFTTNQPVFLEDLKITPYPIPHDAAEPVGFSIENSGRKISITTDLGYVSEDIIQQIKDSQLVVLESNHDVDMLKAGKYPYFLKRRILSDNGHLSNEVAGNTIVELVNNNVQNILLAHLSMENNFPELAMVTVKNILDSNKISMGKDIIVDLAHRDRVSNLYAF